MNSREWLTKLISFNTTSCNTNLPLINRVADWFKAHNIPVLLTHDATQQRANLFATLCGENNSSRGGIILSGHTDTVPVTGQQWDTEPFQAKFIKDRIYGRGACDMKGFLAVVLALVPEWQKLRLKKPIHIAFSYDEEVGCHGVRRLINDIQEKGVQPDLCIVGEPTSMQPVTAHKGICVLHCKIKGLAAHSSLTTKGCNGIHYAAQIIFYIQELAEKFRKKGPFDHGYEVPYTTLSTNLIRGGNAINIIPDQCEFSFECRNLPEITTKEIINMIQSYITEQLLPKMRAECPDVAIDIDIVADVPGLTAIKNEKIESIKKLMQDEALHKVSYATEAGLFQQAGIPTLICGPGSIEQAHKPNEYVTLDQLEKCEIFLRKLSAC